MRDRPETPEEFERMGQITDVTGTHLFSVSAGADTDRATVLFLHGVPTWSWLWRNVLYETGQFTHSIAVDLPGFGPTGAWSNHSFRVTALAETLERFLDQVSPDVLLIVDEAYFEYVRDPDYPDSLRYHTKERAIISLRTFS
jgi:hypothetical protein